MNILHLGFPGGSVVKNPPANVGSMGWKDPLEKEMVTHSSILAWEISWTEEPGRLQSMGLQRDGHGLVTEHAHIIFILKLHNNVNFVVLKRRYYHSKQLLHHIYTA